MKGNRRKLLVLLEQRPRTVRELRELTNMKLSTISEALREWKAFGIVRSAPVRAARRCVNPPHVYGLAGVDLSSAA